MNPGRHNDAVVFLKLLRPQGPWVLSAIVPDGAIETITAITVDDIRKFVSKHEGQRNLYYSVNPTRTAMTSKAAKTDIAAIEYLPADLDPKEGETTEAAKARYLAGLTELKPAPTAIIDSGNGIQLLLKLAEPIILAEPVMGTNKKGKPIKVFPDETAKQIADVENRVKTLMETRGSVAGTQNIDRILRLPGTTNLPNAKKLKAGRTACPTKLIKFNGSTCKLEDFPKPATGTEPPPDDSSKKNDTATDGATHTTSSAGNGDDRAADFFAEASLPADLAELIRDGVPPADDRSAAFYHAVKWLKDEGWSLDDIINLLGRNPDGIALKYGSRFADEAARAFNKPDKNNGGAAAGAAITAPAFSEEHLALVFISRHETDLRFVAKWGQWFHWDEMHWRLEETLYAYDMARAICREAGNACNKANVARGLASAKTVSSVERLSRADRKLAATFEQWDTNQNRINTREED